MEGVLSHGRSPIVTVMASKPWSSMTWTKHLRIVASSKSSNACCLGVSVFETAFPHEDVQPTLRIPVEQACSALEVCAITQNTHTLKKTRVHISTVQMSNVKPD